VNLPDNELRSSEDLDHLGKIQSQNYIYNTAIREPYWFYDHDPDVVRSFRCLRKLHRLRPDCASSNQTQHELFHAFLIFCCGCDEVIAPSFFLDFSSSIVACILKMDLPF